MASEKKTIGFKADSDLYHQIEGYEDRYGHEKRSDAVIELVETGLRETRRPLVYRAKDRVIDWASWLGIMAVIVLVAGGTTTVVSWSGAWKFAFALTTVAVGMVACFEIIRVALGMNEIGVNLWNFVRETRL